MNRKQLLPVLLLTASLMLNACNQSQNDPVQDVTDTESTPAVITETVPDAPSIPVITDQQTEEPVPQTTEALPETEPVPEETAPLPDLPEELPAEDTLPAETEPVTENEVQPAQPIVITKPTIDISDRLTPGGAPVTGQNASAQSDHIRLLLDYSVEQSEDGTVTLTLNVGLSCYELWCSAKSDMGTITVNGVSRTFSTDAIDHMVNEKAYIPFLTQTYNATGSQSASIDVSWVFNGKYGGNDIGTLTTGVILKYNSETGAPAEIVPNVPTTEAPEEQESEIPTTDVLEEQEPEAPTTDAPATMEPEPPVDDTPITEEPAVDTPETPVAPPMDSETPVVSDPAAQPAPDVNSADTPIEVPIPTPDVPTDPAPDAATEPQEPTEAPVDTP